MPGMTMPAAPPRLPSDAGSAVTDMSGMDAHAMAGMAMTGQLGPYPMTRDASGTAWQPDSAAHDGLHLDAGGGWSVMAHGQATLVYDDQGGPRGASKTFVLSHLMLDASRPLAGGTLTLKGLFSLDPLMGKSGYPLILQTGETADGRTRLIDRQHPHDLIGELAASYSHPLGGGVSGFLYGGPAGEPALGPPVYLHRATGLVDPETPIDHHWLDSTHLAFGVVTGGLVAGGWKVEASGFRGREPDQHRYDLGEPKPDSWSVRLSWNPGPDWALEVSRGHLHSVEQLEPLVDQDRTIASAIYNHPFRTGWWAPGFVQGVIAWGRMDRLPPAGEPRRSTDAWLGEGVLTRGADSVFARLEVVDKDELFPDPVAETQPVYTVGKLSLGYQRAFRLPGRLAVDVGGLVSRYDLPRALDAAYGSDPTSFMLFTRLRLRS